MAIRLIGALAGVAATLVFAGTAAAFPLKCRGPLHLTVGGGSLEFCFERASVGGGPNGATLQPGQCAWVDRGVRPAEPNNFRVEMRRDVEGRLPGFSVPMEELLLQHDRTMLNLGSPPWEQLERYLMRGDVITTFDAVARGGGLQIDYRTFEVAPAAGAVVSSPGLRPDIPSPPPGGR